MGSQQFKKAMKIYKERGAKGIIRELSKKLSDDKRPAYFTWGLLKSLKFIIEKIFMNNGWYLNTLEEMWVSKGLLKKYNELVIHKLSNREKINIGCVVSKQYVFDFLICYYSIIESWTFYSPTVHAFTIEEDVHNEIKAYNLPNVKVHFIKTGGGKRDWINNVAMKIKMVEHSKLEKCIVSDVDNIFLAETPELYFLLDNNDYIFIGAPHAEQILQLNLWSFRKNKESIKFARLWYGESLRDRPLSEASGLPFALYQNRNNSKLRIKTLVMDKPNSNIHYPCPYDVQANIRPFELEKDELGFKEKQMGRVKVLHLGGLRSEGNDSVKSRMEVLNKSFPECRCIYQFYLKLANKAAKTMGRKTLNNY